MSKLINFIKGKNEVSLQNYLESLSKIDAEKEVNRYVLSEGTPLFYATRAGEINLARVLLDFGANPNTGGGHQNSPFKDTPFNLSLEIGNTGMAKFLLSKGAHPDPNSWRHFFEEKILRYHFSRPPQVQEVFSKKDIKDMVKSGMTFGFSTPTGKQNLLLRRVLEKQPKKYHMFSKDALVFIIEEMARQNSEDPLSLAKVAKKQLMRRRSILSKSLFMIHLMKLKPLRKKKFFKKPFYRGIPTKDKNLLKKCR